MQTNTFNVGDRVQLIPFKHKGKVATVKYFGAIGRKFGTWVGLELDEDTGENNGDVNGEPLFECKPMHGLLLRNTQVKIYNEDAAPARSVIPSIPTNPLLEEGKTGLGDSPLVTPRTGADEGESTGVQEEQKEASSAPSSKLMQAMAQAIQNPTAVRSQAAGNNEQDAKKKGWQERLERIKQKKQEEKARQKAEEDAKLVIPETDEDKLRRDFAAASGIQRTTDGTLKVAQTDVKKGPTGEEILREAVEETKRVAEQDKLRAAEKESTPTKATTRSSIAMNKTIPKQSPAKPEPGKVSATGRTSTIGAGTTGSRITRMGTQSAKQIELAAKKEEMERQRKLRQTGTAARTTGLRSSVAGAGATGTAASGATSARGTTGRVSARPGAPGTAVPATRMTLAQRTAAAALKKKEEDDAKKEATAASRRPAMSTTSTAVPGLKRSNSRAGSAIRGSSNTRSTIGATGAGTDAAPGLRRMTTTTAGAGIRRDRTPGRAGDVAAKATPMEIRKMENTIKDKETEITRMTTQIKALQTEKTTLTKEKAEKEAQSTKQAKLIAEASSKSQKEKDDIMAKAEREKETIKKQFETKISLMQTQIQSAQEENQNLQANQEEQASMERSKMDEDSAIQLVQLESQFEEQKIKLDAQEQQIAEANGLKEEQESKLEDMGIKMAENEQKIKDQETKITETEAQLAEKEAAYVARIDDMEGQLKQSQREIALIAIKSTEEHKDVYKKMEEEVAAKFEETRKTFETSLLEAQDTAKTASELAKVLQTKFDDEVQRRNDEAEIFELEKNAVLDEKKDLMDRIMEQGQVEEEDPLKDLSLEEIKIQNQKLRQAITALTLGFEEEKKKLENQMKNETGKDKIIAEQDKRLTEMDFLLEEVERKEQERADMEEKLEEIVEYENMVEEMVQEIANREEENEELLEKINEVEEEMALMEELNQGLELDNTEMMEEVTEKERELAANKIEIEQLSDILIDQDDIQNRYKERQQELQKQIKVLSQELADTANEDNRDQVSVLLERQQQLIARLRDAEKKSLQITKSQITMQQERMNIEVVQNMLPVSLMNEALLPCLKKIQSMNFIKHKATMLLREICETQVDNASQIYDDVGQLNQFYNVLLQLSMLCNRLVTSGHRICFFVANMSPGQYSEITKMLAWDELDKITEEVDMMLDLLKEENLAYNYDLAGFEHLVKPIENLQNTVETTFVAFSPEELKEREMLGPAAPEPETQTKRKKLLAKCPKLDLRDQIAVVAIGVTFVPRLSTLYASELERRQVIQKVGLIYWRLLDTILKLDNIVNVDPGTEFLQEEAIQTEGRLAQKYQSIKLLWAGNEAEKQEASQKSWSSVLDAIANDVMGLNNDFKFKQLVEKVEIKYGSGKIDFNDLYNIDYKAEGPWRVVSEQVRSELQDMGALKQRNSNLVEKQKDQLKLMATMKKEKGEAVVIATTLKQQLSQAQARADQVPALEIERNNLMEQAKTMGKQLDLATKDIQVGRTSIEDMKTKLEEAKKQAAVASENAEQEMLMGQANKGIRRQTAIRARPTGGKHESKVSQSSSTAFFKNLQSGGLPGNDNLRSSQSHQRGQSMANSAQMIQQMQITEDIYTETINQLQADRMRLKGKDMFERLTKLQKKDGAFSVITQQLRDTQKQQDAETVDGVTVKLNRAEQLKVQTALESVETLKFKVKRQMATRRIVDLTPKPVASQESKAEEKKENSITISTKNPSPTETFNYMVMDTREKINEAMQVLFSRDSKLRKLQGTTSALPPQSQTQEKQQPNQQKAATADQAIALNQVKVGTLRLRSKIKVPQNRVVLDEGTLAELRRNVALFAS